uniref:Uncharacterized protein n=1 Tax=Spumella elongata TaxID=89044 RepID=A0A7S3H7E9_9STRA|mmetsp:Transcript_38579/g.66682  ORF Transcript_38579/g.66682 Transcript_38579/m.66682 type:complete len:164 (+) Transcript_38579:2-493(+)
MTQPSKHFLFGMKKNKASRVEPALPQEQQPLPPLPSQDYHLPSPPGSPGSRAYIHDRSQIKQPNSPDRWSVDKEDKDDADYLYTLHHTRSPQHMLNALQLQEESKHNSGSNSDKDSEISYADGFVTPFEREQYYLSASSSASASASSSSSSSSSSIEYLEDIV